MSVPAGPAVVADRARSSWSMRDNMRRVAWAFVQATAFRWSFHNWYGWRRWLLGQFGARVGSGVRVRPTVRIEIPWHLELGDDVIIGDFAILYALGNVRVGRQSMISQYAHLCAGSHDYAQPSLPLLTPPITIGERVWIAADAFIGPGVTIGDDAVVAARATVVKDVPSGHVVGGNPARTIKVRQEIATRIGLSPSGRRLG